MLYMLNNCAFFLNNGCSCQYATAEPAKLEKLARSVAFAILGKDDADAWLIWGNIQDSNMKWSPNNVQVYERELGKTSSQAVNYTVFMFEL